MNFCATLHSNSKIHICTRADTMPVPTLPSPPLLKPLLLAGGRSTRMGKPKHLLEMPDGTTLYHHQLKVLQAACPEAPSIYISLSRESPQDPSMQNVTILTGTCKLEFIYDLEANQTGRSAGPAAGLLAAFQAFPDSSWLVLACDYPFMAAKALVQLQLAYRPPVTCFRNTEGYCEPLVGIWNPKALACLAESYSKGKSSPSSVVNELGGQMVTPELDKTLLLCNVNTEEDWAVAMDKLR